jgi:hypothetical protein
MVGNSVTMDGTGLGCKTTVGIAAVVVRAAFDAEEDDILIDFSATFKIIGSTDKVTISPLDICCC